MKLLKTQHITPSPSGEGWGEVNSRILKFKGVLSKSLCLKNN
jgi:hypothetical protein